MVLAGGIVCLGAGVDGMWNRRRPVVHQSRGLRPYASATTRWVLRSGGADAADGLARCGVVHERRRRPARADDSISG